MIPSPPLRSPPLRGKAFCKNHPDRPARRRCFQCEKPICPGCQRKDLGHVFCGEGCRKAFAKAERRRKFREKLTPLGLAVHRAEKRMDAFAGGRTARLLTLLLLAALAWQSYLLVQVQRRERAAPAPSPATHPPAPLEVKLQEREGRLILGGTAGEEYRVALLLLDGKEDRTEKLEGGRFAFPLEEKAKGQWAQVELFGDGVPALFSRSLRLEKPPQAGPAGAALPPITVPGPYPHPDRMREAEEGRKKPEPEETPVLASLPKPPPMGISAPIPKPPEEKPAVKAAPPAPEPRVVAKLPPTPSIPPAVIREIPSAPSAKGTAPDLSRGNPEYRMVAITFDGGSQDNAADRILDVLGEKNIKATFFLTGEFIRRYPEITRRIAKEGHEVGNHMLSHPHLTSFARDRKHNTLPGVNAAFVKKELEGNAELFQKVTGKAMMRVWRAPFGEQNEDIRKWALAAGFRHISWTFDPKTRLSLDTLDWVADKGSPNYLTTTQMVEKVLSFETRTDQGLAGGIILLHLGNERKEDVFFPLAKLIDELENRGYKVAPISELL